jgi:hypothetical protein
MGEMRNVYKALDGKPEVTVYVKVAALFCEGTEENHNKYQSG